VPDHFGFDGGQRKRENKPGMNLKRWFLWLCLAVLVAGEILLYRANQQRDTALVGQREAKHQAEQARSELEKFKASAAFAQGTEGERLRRENQNLTDAVTQLKNETNRLQQANQQLAQQLAATRETAQQQQEKLQQWESASRQASAVVQEVQDQVAVNRDACIKNLRLIDTAKQQWALVNNKTDVDVPTKQDLLSFFPNNAFPVCPSGGIYSINAVGLPPTCSISGHTIP
jgi:general secretion pathway protein G